MNRADLIEAMKMLGVKLAPYNARGWACAPCPLAPWTHGKGSDAHPSFYVVADENGPSAFNCYACGQKGTVERLAMRLHQEGQIPLSLVQEIASKEIPGKFEDWDARRTQQFAGEAAEEMDVNLFHRMFPAVADSREAIAFLRHRRVNALAASCLDLRFDPDSKRVLFPVYDQGKLYGYAGRSILPNVKIKVKNYHFPKRQFLLGEQLFQPRRSFFILEGLMGTARAITVGAGQHLNVAGLMGATMSEEQAAILASYGQPVYLMLDDNEAGEQGIREAARLLGESVPLFVGLFPPRVFDVDDLMLFDIVEIVAKNHLDIITYLEQGQSARKQQTKKQPKVATY